MSRRIFRFRVSVLEIPKYFRFVFRHCTRTHNIRLKQRTFVRLRKNERYQAS